MKRYILRILRGTGQVMLQNNALTGLLFLIGIFYNSWQMGLAGIIGIIASTASALFFNYPAEEIENGLYGFNGVLVGIATCFYFGFNGIAILAILAGSILSTILMRVWSKKIPAFTAPFIISTWLIMLCIILFKIISFLTSASVNDTHFNLPSAVSMGFGQVMFQGNIVTGILFFIAIAVNSRIAACYALYGALVSCLLSLLLAMPLTMIKIGLFGYNAVLCGIALGNKKLISFISATMGIILSVIVYSWTGKIGIIPLTAPFVLCTWIMLLIKNNNLFIKKEKVQS